MRRSDSRASDRVPSRDLIGDGTGRSLLHRHPRTKLVTVAPPERVPGAMKRVAIPLFCIRRVVHVYPDDLDWFHSHGHSGRLTWQHYERKRRYSGYFQLSSHNGRDPRTFVVQEPL